MKNKNLHNTILLLAVVIPIVILIINRFHLVNKLDKSQFQIDSLQRDLKIANLKIEADELFLNGEIEQALKIYQIIDSMVGSDLENQKLNLFVKKKNLASLDSLNSESIAKSYSLALKEIDSLKNLLDAFKNNSHKTANFIESLLQYQYVLIDSIKILAQHERNNKYDTLNFVSSTGSLVQYFGEVSNNKANGKGVGIWSTGGYYYGYWKNNFRHGKGIYKWKNGDKYIGDFYDDQRDGYGMYYWTSGEKYEGYWKKNMRSGQGTLYESDGKVKYSGKWLEDKPV